MFRFVLSIFISTVICFAHPAMAQNDIIQKNTAKEDVVVVPAGPSALELGLPISTKAENVSHDDLVMTPDRSEIIRLDTDAASVIIGNPQHLNVLAENSRTLVLVPRMNGATHLTVLDNKSNIIMQRHVIVGAVAKDKNQYIRIRKSCAGGAKDCQETQMYYCPGMCHEIGNSDGSEASQPAQNASGTGNNAPPHEESIPPPPPPAVDATEG